MYEVKTIENAKELLRKISVAETLTNDDDYFIHSFLKEIGVDVRTVGCGIVILENGLTRSIQTTARAILNIIEERENNGEFR